MWKTWATRLSPICLGGSLLLIQLNNRVECNLAKRVEIEKRKLLPERIILVRHGQSEANVDAGIYTIKGDNKIELTELGSRQACEAGRRLQELVGDEPVHMFISPFQRAYQTARNIRAHLNVLWTTVDPTIREQEMGNLQKNFDVQREEQKAIGRFWYRFEGGESGADVYGRVALFWNVIKNLNLNPGRAHIPNVLVVTHGLTMRLLLMRLFHWSPDTFETVWNPNNCEIWVLKKNLALKTELPYELDLEEGEGVQSSLEVRAIFKNGEHKVLKLDDYLLLPPPRTTQKELAIEQLAKQHDLCPDDIEDIDFFTNKKFSKFL